MARDAPTPLESRHRWGASRSADTLVLTHLGCPQSGEVFLKEHIVLALLYGQLRACSVGVYGRAFLDFRKLFGVGDGSTLKKS